MKKLTVVRSYLESATIGFMDIPSRRLQSMELPWLDNSEGKSCIPEGTYLAVRDTTGKHQFYAIKDVPKRSDIEIHIANYTHQILGCLALGRTRMDDGISVGNSGSALNDLVDYIGDESFMITFRSFNPLTDRW